MPTTCLSSTLPFFHQLMSYSPLISMDSGRGLGPSGLKYTAANTPCAPPPTRPASQAHLPLTGNSSTDLIPDPVLQSQQGANVFKGFLEGPNFSLRKTERGGSCLKLSSPGKCGAVLCRTLLFAFILFLSSSLSPSLPPSFPASVPPSYPPSFLSFYFDRISYSPAGL